VQFLKLVLNVRSTQPLVIFPFISVKHLSKHLFSLVRAIQDSKHKNFPTLMFHPCLHIFLETKELNNKEKQCFVGT